MFSWSNFLTFAVTSAITPGPNNIMAMSNGSKLGFKKAFSFNMGMLLGFTLLMMLCALFCELLTSWLPVIRKPMLFLGAGYMLYLAWKTFRSSGSIEETHSESSFVSGFVLQFVNVKAMIYGIVCLESYVIPAFHGQPVKILLITIIMGIIGFSFTTLWLLFGSAFKLLFSKYTRITNTIMALLLVYCAVSLFL